MNTLSQIVENYNTLLCMERNGFIFTSITNPTNVLDTIVIRSPETCDCYTPKKSRSIHSLKEHIELINEFKLKKALIIAEDISFLKQCPTLEYVEIIPADTAIDNFDYSPLYEMPNLKYLSCRSKYGGYDEAKSTTIDYSLVKGIKQLIISGEGHLNYNMNKELEVLQISNDKVHKDMSGISCSTRLKKISFTQCGLKSLEGINGFNNLQRLTLQYIRALKDISDLVNVKSSLRALDIINCPGITDFSCLHSLVNLEHLELSGRNELKDLRFINNMKNLKTFVFSMGIKDNDLTACMKIPYVYCAKNKREYNLKDKDLPKNLPTEGFEII